MTTLALFRTVESASRLRSRRDAREIGSLAVASDREVFLLSGQGFEAAVKAQVLLNVGGVGAVGRLDGFDPISPAVGLIGQVDGVQLGCGGVQWAAQGCA